MPFVTPLIRLLATISLIVVIGAVICGQAAAAPTPAQDRAKLVSAWFSRSTTTTKLTKTKLPPKIKRAVPKIAARAEKLFNRAKTAKWSKPGSKSPSNRLAAAAAGGKVVETLNLNAGTVNLGGGVMLTAKLEGRAYEDDTKEIKMVLETTAGKDRVVFRPALDLEAKVPEAQCPTAAGIVALESSETVGGTTLKYHDKKLVGAVTDTATATTTSEGHVGRDARLHDISSHVKIVHKHYERGLQMLTTSTAEVSLPRNGSASVTSPTADVKIKAAGASSSAEQAVAREVESGLLKSAAWKGGHAAGTAAHRTRMLADEYKWYDLPNYCARLQFSPESGGTLAFGASATVAGSVTSTNGGGEAAGAFTVTAVGRGAFSATKPLSDPGAPAQFAATGAANDGNPTTVDADVIATSTAGRAQGGWMADSGGKKVDLTFSGHATYSRKEGSSAGQIQHDLSADYTWEVTYKNVDIDAGADRVNFANVSSFDGTWVDNGRFGAAGPGSYACGGALKQTNPELAMLHVTPNGGSYTFSAAPFFVVLMDADNSGCTGLSSPPNTTYATSGAFLPNKAVNTVAAGELGGGVVTKTAIPGGTVASDCSDVIQSVEAPCVQTLTWTGTMTLRPAVD